MYRTIRYLRIAIALLAMGVPTWALLTGYDCVFARMQIFPALLSGTVLCLVFWALLTLLFGRIYCSTVCPLGTLTDCAAATSRLSRRKNKRFVYAQPSSRTRFAFVVLTLAAVLSGVGIIPTLFDPYSAYARMVVEFVARPLGLDGASLSFSVSTLSVAVLTAVAVVVTSWRNGRILCNSACPVGTLLGYVGAKPVFHIEIDPDRCINCGECERVCKAQCIKLPEKLVDCSRCVVCFDCAAVCPNGAITYKAGTYRLDMPMMQTTATGESGSTASSNSPCSKCSKTKIIKTKDETIH